MLSKTMYNLINAGAVAKYLFYCRVPLTTKYTYLDTDYFVWDHTPEGIHYWDNLIVNEYPTQADIDYCKRHYPEYFV